MTLTAHDFRAQDRCLYQGRECLVLSATTFGWTFKMLRLLVLGTDEILPVVWAEDCEAMAEARPERNPGIRLVCVEGQRVAP